ncbi:MAG: N-acetylmuramic acid 6-phosphate etherase [Deltaproteobacteria bacterium]
MSITESESLYNDLEKKSVRELLESIHEEDRKVLPAVHKTIPQIEALVTAGYDLVIGLIAGGDTAIRKAVESAEDNEDMGWDDLQKYHLTERDTIVGIAASGRTPYVIGALKKARENNILTACVTSNPNSAMAKHADIAIEAVVGPEFVTGSTRMKSGTAQKLILNMITTTLMIQLGRVKGNKMVNMQLTNQKLVERGTRMIMEELGLEQDKARNLLLIHGSVKKALDEFRK